MYKKLFSNSVIYGLAPYIPYIASIFILPLTTPYLTASDFGVYGIIMSYLSFLKVLQILSLHVHFPNSYYRNRFRYKWLWRQIYGFIYFWNIIYCILIAVVLYLIIPDEAKSNYFVITILTVTPVLLLNPISNVAVSFYILKQKPLPTVTRNVFFGILTGILNLLFIRYMRMGYMGWFWALSIVNVLTGISWIYPILIKERITPIFNFKWKTIKKSLFVSLPLVPHANALMLLNQSDRVVMDFLNVGAKNIGVYSAAYNLGSTLDSIGGGYNTAITPFIYELLKEKKEKKIRELIFLSQIAFFFVALCFSLIAKELMEFLIRNNELNKAYPLMVIIAMGMIFKPMYIASTIKFFYYEKTKLFALYSLGAGVFNIVLNVIFIPIFGIEAAAVSTFLGFMLLSYSRFWSETYKKISPLPYYENYWMLASVLVCLAGYFGSQLDIVFRGTLLILLLFIGIIVGLLTYKKIKK